MNNLEYIRTLKSLLADFIRDNETADKQYYQEVWDWLDSLPTDSKIEQIKAELQKRLLKYDPDMTNAGRELQEVLAFIDSLPAEESKHQRLRNKESWISEAKREKSFTEYLQGVFEINNGIENDPATLAALHGPTLFELAQKELSDSPDFEAEWKRYTHARKDDMRTNAVTMNVKEVAKHFAEWQKEQMMDEWISVKDALPPVNAEVIVLSDVFNGTYIKDSHCISYGHIVDKRYCVDYDGWNIPGVTHWIPCPKLPEDD